MPLENYIFWLLPVIGVISGYVLLVHTYAKAIEGDVKIHLINIIGVLVISFIPVVNLVATIIIFLAICIFWIKHLSKKEPIFTVKYKPGPEDTFNAIKKYPTGTSNHDFT